jgi:MFS family permease
MPVLPVAVQPGVARARRNLLGLYLLLGITVASWLARLPSIRGSLDLSTAELGGVLVIGSIGSLVTVVVAGSLTSRWGSRRTLLVAAALFSGANILVGVGPAVGSVAVLVVGMVLSSSSFALSNVPLNLESIVVERAMGRSVVPQFHAAFSVGAVVGSMVGAAVSWVGVPVVWHFVGLSVVAFAWRLAGIPGAVLPHERAVLPAGDDAPAPHRGAGTRAVLAAWREPRTLVIGVIVLTAALSEGSANNWLAIAVVDGFDQAEAVADIVFGLFVGAMTVARLFGTMVITRFGRQAVLVGSAISSLIGLMTFGLAPSFGMASAGAVAWGLGAGLVVPIGMASVSGDRVRLAGRVSVVSAFGSLAFLVAPPMIGLVAEAMGTRQALLLITAGLVASIVLSKAVREDDARPFAVRGLRRAVSRESEPVIDERVPACAC